MTGIGKKCQACGQTFGCGPGTGAGANCWCQDSPKVLPVGAGDCLCPACLKKEIALRVGLCGSCRHAQTRKTKSGMATFQCMLAGSDPSFAKYPRLPKGSCKGYVAQA